MTSRPEKQPCDAEERNIGLSTSFKDQHPADNHAVMPPKHGDLGRQPEVKGICLGNGVPGLPLPVAQQRVYNNGALRFGLKDRNKVRSERK